MRTSNQNEIDQLLSKDVSCSPSNPEKGNLVKDVASAEGQTPKASHCFLSHTPGPWEVWPEVHGSHPRHLVYISVGPVDKRRVCSTGVYGHKRGAETNKKPVVSEGECRANARLIAAAPDLLAALKECAAEFRSEPCTLSQGYAIAAHEFQRRMEVARLAYLKATGENP